MSNAWDKLIQREKSGQVNTSVFSKRIKERLKEEKRKRGMFGGVADKYGHGREARVREMEDE